MFSLEMMNLKTTNTFKVISAGGQVEKKISQIQ